MKKDDFRYMRRGKQLAALNEDDLELLQPVNHRSSKKNKALLVLHGFSSSPAVYRYLLPQLKGYDAVVCPVLPGHAKSIEAFSEVKAADWLMTAQNECEQLIKNYSKVDVLGLSLGGLLACELSQLFPINHLYLLAPALKLKINVNSSLRMARVLNSLGFNHVRNSAGNLLSTEHAEIAYRKLPIKAIIEMLDLARQYQWAAPYCPVDLFLGRYDMVIDSGEVEELFKPLDNVTIHWLEHSAHVLPLEEDLHEIVNCINEKA